MNRTPAQNPDERLETALEGVLAAIPGASPRERAILLKRAGDVCVSLDERRKALGWYGRAVDQFLELADTEQAAQVCRLIIYVQPDAVRARCTLTWIAIATERNAEALEELGAYVEAACRAGHTTLAAQQLGWMFAATASREVRERIVLEACTLGDTTAAGALAAQLGGSPPPALDREQRWARLLQATTGPAATTAGAAAT